MKLSDKFIFLTIFWQCLDASSHHPSMHSWCLTWYVFTSLYTPTDVKFFILFWETRWAESPSLLMAYNFLIDFTWELRQLWSVMLLTDKCELIKPPGLPWKKLLIHRWWCSGYHSLDWLPISTGFEFSMSPLMDFFSNSYPHIRNSSFSPEE